MQRKPNGSFDLSKLFIAAGCLLIAILFTALIGPYVIDWTAYRETFEREASAYIGRPVSVAGKASVRLLPTPILSFTDIRIGDAEEPDVEMERFRAEVELAPLLKGEVKVIQMTVERPHFRFDLASLGEEMADDPASGWRIDLQRVSLARLEILDGTAIIADSRAGRDFRAENINGVVEAGSLRGPGRVEAALYLDGIPMVLRAGLGRVAADNSVPANVSITTPLYPLSVSLDGNAAFPDAAPPKFEGLITVAGIAPEEGSNEPRSPLADFAARGGIALTPDAVLIEEAQLSYGAMQRPLVVQASGRLDFGAEPRFDVSIGARQVDVDQALGGGPDQPVAIAAAYERLVQLLPELPKPPFPGQLHLDAQGLVIGGSVMQAVGLDLATGAEGWRLENLAATLPGETRVDLRGELRLSMPPAFKGHGRVESGRPAAFSAWWNGQAGSAAVLEDFTIEADLDLVSGSQRFSEIVARTGGGTVKGFVELRRFAESGERFVTVDLSADRADLVEMRALGELVAGNDITAQRVEQMTLSLRADTLIANGVEARSVVVDGALEAGNLQIRRLSVADLAGASIEARGSIADPFGKPSGRLDASFSAKDITGAAEFLGSVLPESSVLSHLRRIAPALSPAEAEVSAELGVGGRPLSLDLTGSFAETHVTVAAAGQGTFAEPETLNGTLKVHVDGADTAKVLTQFGLEPLPVEAGPLTLDGDFAGSLASAGKLNVTARIAGVEMSYAAETSMREGRITAAGDFRAESGDVDQVLLLTGLAAPGVGEGHALTAAGRLDLGARRLRLALNEGSFEGQPVGGFVEADLRDGMKVAGALDLDSVSLPFLTSLFNGVVPEMDGDAWTDSTFAPAVPPELGLRFKLSAGVLDLGLPIPARDAVVEIGLTAGQLNIDLAQAEFAGGKLQGAIAGTIKDGEAEVSLRGAMQGGELQALVWESRGLPIASGRLDASFDMLGRGRSMTGLVSSLAGSGSFAVNEGRINALNPEALAAVMRTAEGEEEPDEDKAREIFASTFSSGALPFGRAAGSFSISGGVMNVATVSIAAGTTNVLADATLDLNSLALASDWSIRSGGGSGPKDGQPSVGILFSGPVTDPERRVDLNPLINLLRSRYLQRQLDELQELEQARQQAEERRRRAERQDANAQARQGSASGEEAPPALFLRREPSKDQSQPGQPQSEPDAPPAPLSAPELPATTVAPAAPLPAALAEPPAAPARRIVPAPAAPAIPDQIAPTLDLRPQQGGFSLPQQPKVAERSGTAI